MHVLSDSRVKRSIGRSPLLLRQLLSAVGMAKVVATDATPSAGTIADATPSAASSPPPSSDPEPMTPDERQRCQIQLLKLLQSLCQSTRAMAIVSDTERSHWSTAIQRLCGEPSDDAADSAIDVDNNTKGATTSVTVSLATPVPAGLRGQHWTSRMMALCASALGTLANVVGHPKSVTLVPQLRAAASALASDVSPLRRLGADLLLLILACGQRYPMDAMRLSVSPDVVRALGNVLLDEHAHALEQRGSRHRSAPKWSPGIGALQSSLTHLLSTAMPLHSRSSFNVGVSGIFAHKHCVMFEVLMRQAPAAAWVADDQSTSDEKPGNHPISVLLSHLVHPHLIAAYKKDASSDTRAHLTVAVEALASILRVTGALEDTKVGAYVWKAMLPLVKKELKRVKNVNLEVWIDGVRRSCVNTPPSLLEPLVVWIASQLLESLRVTATSASTSSTPTLADAAGSAKDNTESLGATDLRIDYLAPQKWSKLMQAIIVQLSAATAPEPTTRTSSSPPATAAAVSTLLHTVTTMLLPTLLGNLNHRYQACRVALGNLAWLLSRCSKSVWKADADTQLMLAIRKAGKDALTQSDTQPDETPADSGKSTEEERKEQLHQTLLALAVFGVQVGASSREYSPYTVELLPVIFATLRHRKNDVRALSASCLGLTAQHLRTSSEVRVNCV